jgi:hypothetical protein
LTSGYIVNGNWTLKRNGGKWNALDSDNLLSEWDVADDDFEYVVTELEGSANYIIDKVKKDLPPVESTEVDPE